MQHTCQQTKFKTNHDLLRDVLETTFKKPFINCSIHIHQLGGPVIYLLEHQADLQLLF